MMKSIAQRRNEVTWSIGGEAGYGIKVVGGMFGKVASRAGLRIFDYTEYPSLIRGGYNNYRVEVAEHEVRSVPEKVDILVALNSDTIAKDGEDVEDYGIIVYDSGSIQIDANTFEKRNIVLYPIPFREIALDVASNELMKNTVALGASVGLLNLEFSYLEKVLQETFADKGEKVVSANVAAAKRGYEYAEVFNKKECRFCLQAVTDAPKRILVNGSEASGLGAIAAGLQFYAGYPMTPSTPLLEYLAGEQERYGYFVHQAEDEITAINAAIGASFAGARAMTGSSGGGFSLMVESIGLAAITETPITVYIASRPGPATGLPTWTNQGDLQFVLHAAQDEFPRIVVAPGDAESSFTETARALNLAEKYQIPVFILSDKYLAESTKNTEPFNAASIAIDRGKLMTPRNLKQKTDFFPRYEDTEDGTSRRPIPGQKNGIHIANSDEHNEFGIADETSQNRIVMYEKRYKKMPFIEAELPHPKLYGEKDAEVTVLAWGSTKGVVLDAMRELEKEGVYVNMLHVMYVYPYPKKMVIEILSHAKNILLIENNGQAQFGALTREHTGIDIQDQLLKYDGRPFFLEEVVSALRSFVKRI